MNTRERAGGTHPEVSSDAAVVLAHVRAALGEPAGWSAPVAHTSVALAVIDSVWGINSRWTSVRNVIDRYRRAREQTDGDSHLAGTTDPDSDTPEDLLDFIESSGGADAFAEVVQNRQRTSTRNGILKAEAVKQVASVLRDHRIRTPADVCRASSEQLAELRQDWIQIPGQRSGLSLDAFLLATGRGSVKADRMVRRFVADALQAPGESAVKPARAAALVEEAATLAQIDARLLDAAIWQYESDRARTRRGGVPAV
jgi:hypothetical protein